MFNFIRHCFNKALTILISLLAHWILIQVFGTQGKYTRVTSSKTNILWKTPDTMFSLFSPLDSLLYYNFFVHFISVLTPTFTLWNFSCCSFISSLLLIAVAANEHDFGIEVSWNFSFWTLKNNGNHLFP